MDDTFSFGFWGKSSEELLHSKFPMHRACRDGDLAALSDLLMSSAEDQHDLFAEDQFYGWTPAHWSAYYGKLDCLQKLVLAGISFDVATERFNQTPTHVAAFGNQPHCLLWLLQNGTVVNGRDYLGETAMHKAARCGSIDCLNLLQSFGAIPSVPNNNGHTALDLAVTCGHQQCAEYLRQTVNSAAGHSNSHPQSDVQSGQCDVQAGINEHVNGHVGRFNGQISMDLPTNVHNGFFSRKRTMMDGEENGSKKARTDDSPTPLHVTDSMFPRQTLAAQPVPPQAANGSIPNTNGTHSLLDVNSNSETNAMQVDTGEEAVPNERSIMNGVDLTSAHDRRSSPMSSMVEHQKSVEQAQGYDSVMYDCLYGGAPFCHAY